MSKRTERETPTRVMVTRQTSVPQMLVQRYRSKMGTEAKSKRHPDSHSRSITPAAMTEHMQIEGRRIDGDTFCDSETFYDIPTGTTYFGAPESACSLRKVPYLPAGDLPREAPYRPLRKMKSQKSVEKGFSISGGGATGFDEVDGDDNAFKDFLVGTFSNSTRETGFGIIAKLVGGSEKDYEIDNDRRPFFTWWVTVVQLIIYIVVVCTYGFAPVGVTTHSTEQDVLMTSLAVERQSYQQKSNPMLGPREEDLILVGAKYSPCMRRDLNVVNAVNDDRKRENKSACCVRNDGSGCFQSAASECPSGSLTTWHNWTVTSPGPGGRVSGSVCGQDPRYCTSPASTGAHVWVDDITRWPICLKSANASTGPGTIHMNCEIIGRPCCIGFQGECRITTREYCDLQRGHYHQDLHTCSQVSCMNDICGLLPFADQNEPDQFYRLFFSLFLHTGILPLIITIILQLLVMRDLEKLIGWWRLTIIYIGGGVTGSLASAIFLPYLVEAGPAGSQFAVIAALYLEIIRWNKKNNLLKTTLKLALGLALLFLLGALFPGVDNWAHLFGFCFGLLLSISFRPYKSICGRQIPNPLRYAVVVMCILLSTALFGLLVVYFYVYPIYSCKYCSYFNCIPYTPTFCDDQQIKIRRSASLTS